MPNSFLATAACASFIVLAACAPAATGDLPPTAADAAPPAEATIEIEHNQPGLGTLTVYLDDGVGPRRLLGTVAQGRVEAFTLEGPLPAATLRLIGEAPLRRGIASRPFNLAGRNGVRWVLSPNRIQPLGRDGSEP